MTAPPLVGCAVWSHTKLKRGHCIFRSTVLAAPPAMFKDNSGGGQTAVGLDPINDGVQPDVLQRGRPVKACRRSRSQEVRVATRNVSSMVCRSRGRSTQKIMTSVVLKRQGGSARMLGAIGRRYNSFCRAVIKGLLVLMCLFN